MWNLGQNERKNPIRLCRALLPLSVAVLFWSSWASAADPLETFAAEFVEITPGEGKFSATFSLGSSAGPATQQPVTTIEVTRPFRISRYEIWQDLYSAVMGNNPSRWQGPRNSVEQVTWNDAQEFCRRATALLRQRGQIPARASLRLPTEAEWEYCCRAGTDTAYSFGDDGQSPDDVDPKASLLDRYAWHAGNAAGNDPAVGALQPNDWGLYDMHGYLSEFTQDGWTPSHAGAPARAHDVRAPDDPRCVIRGGSWKDRYPLQTSATRRPYSKNDRSDAVGFRCVLETNDADAP